MNDAIVQEKNLPELMRQRNVMRMLEYQEFLSLQLAKLCLEKRWKKRRISVFLLHMFLCFSRVFVPNCRNSRQQLIAHDIDFAWRHDERYHSIVPRGSKVSTKPKGPKKTETQFLHGRVCVAWLFEQTDFA